MQLSFDNKLSATGDLVVLREIDPQQAIESIREDRELSSLSDERLQSLIEETDSHWREVLKIAENHPEGVVIYPLLMVACAEVRLKAIRDFRETSSDDITASFIERDKQWTIISVRCLLAGAMAWLLLPAPNNALEDLNVAYKRICYLNQLSQQLHLREMLWACYGRRAAAVMAKQPELAEVAEQDLTRLMLLPEHLEEAQIYIREIEESFERIWQAIDRKETLKSVAEVNQTSSIDTGNTEYFVYYNHQINHYGNLVVTGQMPLTEAKQKLAGSLDLSQLDDRKIYLLSMYHRRLAETAPENAAILADLNYTVASLIKDDSTPTARTHCAYVLGMAFMERARLRNYEPESFCQAIPYLEEAFTGLESSSKSDPVIAAECGNIAAKLVTCNREIGNLEKALECSYKAIRLLEKLPDRHSDLGTVYGNLADLQEKKNQLDAARENHYKALERFLEVNDLLRAKQALSYFSHLCLQTGHIDDAIAASERIADLMVKLADLKGAVKIYLSIIDCKFRINCLDDAIRIWQRTEKLISPYAAGETVEKDHALLYCDLMNWLGAFYSMVVAKNPDESTFKQAYESLETARRIAVDFQDNERLVRTLLQLSRLCIDGAKLESAEQYCKAVSDISCSPIEQMRHTEIIGEIRLRQNRYEEAINYFQEAIKTYEILGYKDRKAAALYEIGEAYRNAGAFKEAVVSYEAALDTFENSRLDLYEESRMAIMANAVEIYAHVIWLYANLKSEIYDSKKSLFWLEKSKSRTFLEAIGLSSIPLQEAPNPIQTDLLEEKQLLQKLNDLRWQRFLNQESTFDSLSLQQEIHSCLKTLKIIWEKVSVYCPEYSALRQGNIVDWDELQKLLKV